MKIKLIEKVFLYYRKINFKYMGNYSAVFSRIKIPPAFGGGVRGVEKLP